MRALPIPKDKSFFPTLGLLRDGYKFLDNRRRDLNAPLFETRLLGKRAICFCTPSLAQKFYDPTCFDRRNIMPNPVKSTLTGHHGVQQVDGANHATRKDLFISLMNPDSLQNFYDILNDELKSSSALWKKQKEICFFDEMQKILCRSACGWAGVPLTATPHHLAKDLGAMVDGFGGIGRRHFKGRAARKRSETWARTLITDVIQQKIHSDQNTAFYKIATFPGMTIEESADDLLNILRPITAIATYATFVGLALFHDPHQKLKIETDDNYTEYFVQEVRRFYPFTPFVGARSLHDINIAGHVIPRDTLVLLDIYGINHNPDFWTAPDEFSPDRFKTPIDAAHTFMPQGGGPLAGHRCPGEQLTVGAMKIITNFLLDTPHKILPQDLTINLGRIPTRPADGLKMALI